MGLNTRERPRSIAS